MEERNGRIHRRMSKYLYGYVAREVTEIRKLPLSVPKKGAVKKHGKQTFCI
jgi:hypothetical protein